MRKPNTTCFFCEQPCYVRPGQMQTQSTWFCSRECHKSYVDENLLGECGYCGNKYKRKSSDRKYCSRSCSNYARTGIKYTGERPGCRIQRGQRIRAMLDERDGRKCGNPDCIITDSWCGKPIKLQIEHIDGNRKNNEPSNLMYLCPNCHSQTSTWSIPKARLTDRLS